METQSPPALPQKNWRRASLLNLLLPGAGLFMVGRRVAGALLASAFLACFGAMLALFLVSYGQYLSFALSGKILEGNRLEKISGLFHPRWMIGLLLVGVAIYILSAVALSLAARRARTQRTNLEL